MANWLREDSAFIRCSECDSAIQFSEIPLGYFKGESEPCPKCGRSFDWWKSVFRQIKENYFNTEVLHLIGAQTTFLEIVLERSDVTKVDLRDHGIPTNAKILSTDYTPQTEMWYPTEILGNSNFKYRRERFVSPVLELYPWPAPLAPPGPVKAEPRMVIRAVWVIPQGNDETWKNMFEALVYFVHDEHESVIVPANTAVECALGKLLGDWLTGIVSKERSKNFLTDAATYGHQLNVLLPALMTCLNGPVLSSDIRGLLNRLKGFRNEIVHDGRPSRQLSKDDCAEMLCAALFALNYVRVIKPFFQSREK
jgi:hypothetical protein